MAKLHIFDMDNTLINCDCDVTWKQFVVKHGMAPESAIAETERFFADYDNGKMDQKSFIDFQLAEIKGRSMIEMGKLTRQHFAEFVLENVRPAAMEAVLEAFGNGEDVALLTGTNEVITRPVADHFHISEICACGLEIVDGIYTGNVIPPYPCGASKIYYLGALCSRHNVTPADVTAYGDSVNDIPLLEMVGDPVAVSPSPQLREYAEKKHWRIVEW